MHSILPSIAAKSFGVSKAEIFRWIERGLLNSKRTKHGSRILVDALWRRRKKLWQDGEIEPLETDSEWSV